jgi:dTDP-4-amino-4,6-dideoxygalactose transaminase
MPAMGSDERALATLNWRQPNTDILMLPVKHKNSSEKSGIADLALFGGRPAFERRLHVGRPNIGNRERLFQRLNQMLDNGWLSNAGPLVCEFERRVAEMIGVRHCVAMCNATIALEIAIRAAGMTGEVIIPSFTFVATAHALQWQQITPIFCDIDERTHLLDPQGVEKLITPQTTGIVPVHLWGRPCSVDALEEIARRRGLKIIYDAAHAFGCSHNDRMLGSFGDAEVFSFHATKFFNTFEGGAVVTNDDDLAGRIRLMQNFGFTGYDRADYLGINGKMAEPAAAMGLTSLESLGEFIEINERNYEAYHQELADLPGVKMLSYDRFEKNNFQYIVLEIDETGAGISRDDVVKILMAENIIARRYFYPGCHRMEPYRSLERYRDVKLPETERLSERVVCLPNGMTVSEDEIRRIADLLRFVFAHAEELSSRLQSSVCHAG